MIKAKSHEDRSSSQISHYVTKEKNESLCLRERERDKSNFLLSESDDVSTMDNELPDRSFCSVLSSSVRT